MKKRQSIFEKLTGSFRMFPTHDEEDEDMLDEEGHREVPISSDGDDSPSVPIDEDGELGVDLYETPRSFIIKAVIAGTDPDEIQVDITRDTVTIRGNRHNYATDDEGSYLVQELFWGSFSRVMKLPEEIEVDDAEAHESRGVLTITLPKIDHGKSASLKVRNKS